MNKSLNIKQINQFICVCVNTLRFEDECSTCIDPSKQVWEYAYEQ